MNPIIKKNHAFAGHGLEKQQLSIAACLPTDCPEGHARETYKLRMQRAELPIGLRGPLEFKADIPERVAVVEAVSRWLDALELGRASIDDNCRPKFYPANSAGLYLCGRPGAGKTLLAGIIARTVMFQSTLNSVNQTGWGHSAVWISAANFIIQCRTASTGRGDTSETEFWERLENASLLVLDDLGTAKLNEWEMGRVAHLIDGRIGNRQTLIVTSNFTRMEIGQAVGSRIQSRLWDLDTFPPFPLEDYREMRARNGGG